MALHFVFGPSGAGKSYTVYQKIIKESMEHPNQRYLVLVPEQFTMQTQKDFVMMHPRGGIMNIDILSFERLAYRVLEETGEAQGQFLEETGKSLVLRKVAQNKKKELKILGEKMKKTGYISQMKSMVSELKQYEITAEDMDIMEEYAKGKPELYYKLHDIAILYQGFFDYLEGNYIVQEEVLEVLGQKAAESSMLKDCVLVLDGYTGFTPIQMTLLRRLFPICSEIYVTVTMDKRENPYHLGKRHQLFYLSRETVNKLCKLAGETGIEMKEIWAEEEKGRFAKNPPMAFLEKNLFRYSRKTYEKEQDAVHIRASQNPGEEMEETVLLIRRLLRTKEYRCRDIAVITGDMETYAGYAKRAFEKYEIPCFIDQKHTVLLNPFIEFIRAAVDMAVEQFSYESVFRLLRCGLMDIAEEEMDRLENYVVALGIRGYKRWSEPWVRTYKGENSEEVPYLNQLRERLMEVWEPFIAGFRKKGSTVRDYVLALYELAISVHAQEKLKEFERHFAEIKQMAMVKEYSQIYGIIMELLDKMVNVLGEETVSTREFKELLEAGLSEAKVGIIPPSTDQIVVGDMERTRLKDVKVLFFVGMNDGKIPKEETGGKILSDLNREELKGSSVTLAPTAKENLYTQRFYLYVNMTKPSDALYLSYSNMSASGEAMSPSYLIGGVKKLFPGLVITDNENTKGLFLEAPESALSVLTEQLRVILQEEPDEKWKELYTWYFGNEEWKTKLAHLLNAAFYRNPQDKIGKATAQALYGTTLENSATRLELFAKCACAHFLSYGLLLKERAKYEFNAVDMGNVLHSSLEQFARKMQAEKKNWRLLEEEERTRLADACVDEIVHDYGNTILHSSARNEYMVQRLKRIVRRTVWALQEQIKHGEFTPSRFEVSFAMADSLESVNIALSEHETMKLKGRIDRIDVCEDEEHVYVKVIDYKSGNTSFDLVALYHGLQLQLALYLNAAVELEQKAHPYKQVVPAGIFYYNMKDPVVGKLEEEDLEDLKRRILKELRMNGIAVSDAEVLQKLDEELTGGKRVASSVVPVSLNKDGSVSKTSSTASKKQFDTMQSYVNHKIRSIGRSILDGEVGTAPYELGNRNACQYCPYQSVCGFDEKIGGYHYRRLAALKPEDIWIKMQEETGKEEGHGSTVDERTETGH